jgi:hypothetical protein
MKTGLEEFSSNPPKLLVVRSILEIGAPES